MLMQARDLTRFPAGSYVERLNNVHFLTSGPLARFFFLIKQAL